MTQRLDTKSTSPVASDEAAEDQEMAKLLRVNAPQVIHEAIEGEVIIINLTSGNYYSLKGSGAEIWQLVQGVASDEDIVETLTSRYGPTPEIEGSVSDFLSHLEREGLTAPAEAADRTSAPDEALRPEQETVFVTPSLEKFTDMQDLVLLDPVHEVDATGWPQTRPDDAAIGTPGT
jgi:Coenzyme PQQ synthesis protein D (PqqD)